MSGHDQVPVIETYFSPGCQWCRQPIQPGQPWLLRSKMEAPPDPYHHDCYLYGVIPAEQAALKRGHAERMTALQEPR